RDDDGVLAARLGEEAEVVPPGAEHLRGLVATGEDHAVDVVVGDEFLPEVAVFEVDEVKHLTGYAGAPQGVDHDGTAALRLTGGLDDGGCAGGECGEGRSGGDRDGEVPRGCDDDEAARHVRGAVDVL